ncbi:hypothetical protein PR048_009128 [Dryococelus australis]|uniref:Uncharacterized protein n=1 Tax=Dryococelus australis TaxID=614101 RepID=A0ABQ9I0W5_9NEOP|nr:hypothetical protein PR048_009128 [Dryococelus australis]
MRKRGSTFRMFKRARKSNSILAAQMYCRPNRHREPCGIFLKNSVLINSLKMPLLSFHSTS